MENNIALLVRELVKLSDETPWLEFKHNNYNPGMIGQDISPKYHIIGHVHEEGLQRKAMLGGTTFLNVSYFEELRRNLGR